MAQHTAFSMITVHKISVVWAFIFSILNNQICPFRLSRSFLWKNLCIEEVVIVSVKQQLKTVFLLKQFFIYVQSFVH